MSKENPRKKTEIKKITKQGQELKEEIRGLGDIPAVRPVSEIPQPPPPKPEDKISNTDD